MRPSENGASSSVRLMPTGCAAGLLGRATNGIWMRCFSKINGRFPLPLACSRSGWRRVGYSGPEPEGQEGSQEVLSQAIKRLAVCPAGDHHRQAEELRRGEGRSVAECRSLPRQVAEQPRREFASANEVEGARDETVQVSRAHAALPLSLR